eukprot:CAMPEP_0196598878 /NCGR_PEP_ID=MMETSP1081-20130531/94559_1 /TAXON_ID=36882 /ORGANISM="Pyramimonas amylifera, Strain CCMP720" /LENGTH=259 /DNA_ID=CAMNT_0041924611 /DNA_START=29 /DNA_END=807 /DNA_ORIENTATION=+
MADAPPAETVEETPVETPAEIQNEAPTDSPPDTPSEQTVDMSVESGKVQCLVLNAGSSSLKYALFDILTADSAKEIVCGLVEKIGLEMGSLKHEPKEAGDEKPVVIEMPFPDHKDALAKVIELLTEPGKGQVKSKADIRVVGHRVVHGGESFTSATLIDDSVLDAIREAAALAPLHNPANISGIEVAKLLFPDSKQVAVFDTAFHLTMPPEAFMYAIPKEYYKEQGIRRYGFHGSRAAMEAAITQMANDAVERRLSQRH